ARTGERTSLVSRHRRKDGTLRDVKLTIFLTQQGAQGMLIVSIKDITEQKRAEQEKKRHEATLDSLINSISDLIFYKDPQGRYLGCNTAFAALAGRPVAEVVGLTCHDVHPPEAAGAEEARDRRCLAELREQKSEARVSYPTGESVMLDTHVWPLWDENGEPRGVLGISRDITARKKQEEETRRAKELAEEATRMKS